jgi:hypothetical protein
MVFDANAAHGAVPSLTAYPGQAQWFAEREAQVLGYFRQHRHRSSYLASCCCPHDGRVLGAVSRLRDGIWLWKAGARFAPAAGWDEFEAFYLDQYDPSEWTTEVYEQAAEYADEELRAWGGRLIWDSAVEKIVVNGPDDEICTMDRFSPQPCPGLDLTQTVTCGCRRLHMLPVLALFHTGLRAAMGIAKPGTHVRPMPPRFPPFRPRPPGESVYSFQDGKIVIDIHERP